jgi:putative nucleotidyltransferase with HDIG domain
MSARGFRCRLARSLVFGELVRDVSEKIVDKSQLRIGLFIHLDLPWMAHPFMTSSFKIRTQKQLDVLRSLEFEQVRIDPARSDDLPASEPQPEPAQPLTNDLKDDLRAALWEEKQSRIRVLKERRVRLNQCAKRYTQSVGSARKLMAHLRASPVQAAEEAQDLVVGMVDDLTDDQETTVQLVNLKHQDENSYFHSINVVALALVVGQKMNLEKAQLRQLGLGALFHDLGHQKIPYQILHKKGEFTRPERLLYEQHPRYGAEIARTIGSLPPSVVEIIAKHHGHQDGSGFPEGLRAADIGLLTRIVTVVNRYDNLCNGIAAERGLSPHQAISRMYSRERACYDPKVLTLFITNLGVYPPGTVVRLNDERIALVISLNQADLLKPNVLLYSPDIPKEESLVLNLAEEDVGIRESLCQSDLSQDQLEYLNLSDKLSYYFQSSSGAKSR